ncbi:uncharacterized protein LOC111984837 [Quercus suber]|uniref:uncharacterized protein LOC111984837 n=1 Tax=Quercus suber TaxID=58331 RepID=UPI000CE16D2B|nr:uncharacterized protein LOC111984837 [Quercus suber]
MGLDQCRHNISIVYRAPQLVVGTQVVYKSLQLSCGAEVKMMWEVVEQMVVKGFVASELYVTVEPTIVEAGEGSQHTTFPGVNSIEEEAGPQEVHEGEHLSHDELHGGTFENEDDYGVADDATHIDVTRDEFEEFLDTMGEHEDVDHIEDVVVEENRDTCPGPDSTPKWFTKNTWDNMFDPSPVMQAEVSSWTPGEQPLKGMVFATKLAVKFVLTWYVLQENFSFKTEHSDLERLIVSCEDDSCPWLVRATCCKGDNVWKIAKCKGPHTCDKIQNAHNGRMIDSVFLAYVLERYIREDPAYKIKNLRHVVLADLKLEVSQYKVWDAKQKAVAAIYGDFKESYAELPRFLARLTDASPGTQYNLLLDDNYERGTCTFKSVFWAFRPCIVGFKKCRPVISIDATHLYGKYKGKLMIAMATDANNKIYPLAFAVVESESIETWGWFLACIRTHPGIQAIFRDTNRDVSLRPPMTEHRYCLRHLCSNVNTRWKNETLKNLVWRAASATQERKFNATFDSIENVNRDAHRYLKDVPKEKWALTFDNGYRYGAMTTNVSECFNSVL